MMRVPGVLVAAVVVAVVGVGLGAAVALTVGDGRPESATRPTQPPPEPPPSAVPSTQPSEPLVCTPADPTDVAAIEAALSGGARSVGPAYQRQFGEYRFIVADIYDMIGSKLASANAWVFVYGVPTALSKLAVKYTDVADFGDVVDPLDMRQQVGRNEFDVADELTDCITT